MKLQDFLNAVRFARAAVVVEQQGINGFSIKAVSTHTSENETTTLEMFLTTANDSPRLFKSIASIPDFFRQHNITSFTVKLSSETVNKTTRTKSEKKATTKTKP